MFRAYAVGVSTWEQRVDELWRSFDDLDEATFVTRMEALADELPDDSATAAFERASAFDSTGREEEAVAHYRRALRARARLRPPPACRHPARELAPQRRQVR